MNDLIDCLMNKCSIHVAIIDSFRFVCLQVCKEAKHSSVIYHFNFLLFFSQLATVILWVGLVVANVREKMTLKQDW